MKAEAIMFGGVAAFFAVTALAYGLTAREAAGSTALTISFLMSALVSFFFHMQHRKLGSRAQDRPDAEVADTAGPLDFFPPRSAYPILAALGFALSCLGVVFGLWLSLIGLGTAGAGVAGFVFQYNDRGV